MINSKSTIISYYKGLIFSPSKFFSEILFEGKYKKETIIVFMLGVIITFAKTFYLKELQPMNYYDSKFINDLLTFLGLPRISWLLGYILYFSFLYMLYKCYACKFKNKLTFNKVFFPIISINGIALFFHLLLFPFNAVLPHFIKTIIVLIVSLWVILLIFKALCVIYKTSYQTLIPCFLIASIVPFVMMGFTIYSPPLASITTNIFK